MNRRLAQKAFSPAVARHGICCDNSIIREVEERAKDGTLDKRMQLNEIESKPENAKATSARCTV